MSKQELEYLGKRMELIKRYREDLKLEKESVLLPKTNYEFMKNNMNEAVAEMIKDSEIELQLKEANYKDDYNHNLKHIITDITEKLNNWKKHIQTDKLIYITFRSRFIEIEKDVEEYLVSENGFHFPKKHITINISDTHNDKKYPYLGRIYISFD
jgi:hypothetical protein